MSNFERKNKYIVIKRKDLWKLTPTEISNLDNILDKLMDNNNYVVIKEGYPEYEYCWKAIEERVLREQDESQTTHL